MESKKVSHLMYVPFTGLGLYGGYRGRRWLRNRIQIFKHFVLPSLQTQTCQDFILWISWRHEDMSNPLVKELDRHIQSLNMRYVFTYSGVCFWDDKYPDQVARTRLVDALHGAMGPLLNAMGDCDEVLMTIQPSDDCYKADMVEEIQRLFRDTEYEAIGYSKGYVMDYIKGRFAEWNPETTPPFYTIRFDKETFGMHHINKHLEYTGPYRSHEYVKNYLKALYLDERGFIVGTHGENISTIFNHPYAGHEFLGDNVVGVLKDFFPNGISTIKLQTSLRKKLMRKLPHRWQRKLRYLLGEKLVAKIYDWLRS